MSRFNVVECQCPAVPNSPPSARPLARTLAHPYLPCESSYSLRCRVRFTRPEIRHSNRDIGTASLATPLPPQFQRARLKCSPLATKAGHEAEGWSAATTVMTPPAGAMQAACENCYTKILQLGALQVLMIVQARPQQPAGEPWRARPRASLRPRRPRPLRVGA